MCLVDFGSVLIAEVIKGNRCDKVSQSAIPMVLQAQSSRVALRSGMMS